MKIALAIVAALTSSMASTTTLADHYAIQVGAYRNIDTTLQNQLEVLGKVNLVQKGSITRVLIGEYSDRQSATNDLARIQNSGFADAFVRSLDHSQTTNAADAHQSKLGEHSHGGETHTHLPNAIQAKIDKLSPAQRQNVVLLDGQPHLKQGENFIPL